MARARGSSPYSRVYCEQPATIPQPVHSTTREGGQKCLPSSLLSLQDETSNSPIIRTAAGFVDSRRFTTLWD